VKPRQAERPPECAGLRKPGSAIHLEPGSARGGSALVYRSGARLIGRVAHFVHEHVGLGPKTPDSGRWCSPLAASRVDLLDHSAQHRHGNGELVRVRLILGRELFRPG